MNIILSIVATLIAAVICGLAELVLHYLPWRLMLNGRDLQPPWSYVLGVLAMLGPYSALLIFWLILPPPEPVLAWALAGLLAVVLSSGLAVIAAYLVDAVLRWRAESREGAQALQLVEVGDVETE
ncbi:MAG: hypothetical protein DWQ07_14010 [Chloroflexi bacterium]|nr:MAG: hypothetical protein DWQ07_14010 [Chloroflexota bacterium]